MTRTRPAERPFTIGDGMILLAAVAAGLAWIGPVYRVSGSLIWAETRELGALGKLDAVADLGLPMLPPLTLAVLALRLRRPRPGWRRASGRAGTSASLAAVVGGMVLVPPVGSFLVRRYLMAVSESWFVYPSAALLGMLAEATPAVGFAVGVTWVVQAVQLRWRADRGWIDRAGRGLGLLWITAGLWQGYALYLQIP